MKYTKEYCKENKICISIVSGYQVKKIDEIFGCNHDYFYNDVVIVGEVIDPTDNTHSDIPYIKSRGYTIITFEELMQDLNQKEMKEYRHKFTNQIAFLSSTGDFYLTKGSALTVPKEWVENSNDWEEIIQPEFKVGDIVCTLPGFSSIGSMGNKDYAGAGYKENYIFEIKSITQTSSSFKETQGDQVLWDAKSQGMYSKAIRLATEKEILEYNKPKKGDYMIHIVHDTDYWTKGKVFQFGAYDFSVNNEMILEWKNNKIYSARAYTKNCRKATPEEIKAYQESQELRIGEHKLEIIQDGNFTNKAKFGCQEFDINELRTIRRLFDISIRAKLTILEGTEITGEFIDKIIAKL